MAKVHAIAAILIYFAAPGTSDEMKIVHAIWRHGDRAPTTLIPTDVNNTASTWPQGLGELSTTGMRQEFKLGQTLNGRYSGKLVSFNYKQPEIYVRSDDYNRTIMSAMSNLAGFYQNSTSQVNASGWPSSYWQPIPIHMVSLDDDNVIATDMPCPKVDQITTDVVMQNEDYIKSSDHFQPLFDYLTSVCGKVVTLDNINDIFDPLNCELIHYDDGHRWPNYINDSIFEQIVEANAVSWDFQYSNPTIARLRGGNMLGDLVNRMQQKRTSLVQLNDSSLNWVRKLKFYMYSAHDTSLDAFMNTLGAQKYVDGQPGYSSCALLELWATPNDTDFYVKTYYRDNSTEEFFEIQVDGCPNLPDTCSLDTFYQRSIDFIPQNWAQECSVSSRTTFSFPAFFYIIFLVLFSWH
jgi:hypothetical protein